MRAAAEVHGSEKEARRAAACMRGAEKTRGLYALARPYHPRAAWWGITGSICMALQSSGLGAEVITMQESREIAQAPYPYCTQHNRLFPHPVVGWLTPASADKLHTVPARCDRCKVEEQSGVILCYPSARLP